MYIYIYHIHICIHIYLIYKYVYLYIYTYTKGEPHQKKQNIIPTFFKKFPPRLGDSDDEMSSPLKVVETGVVTNEGIDTSPTANHRGFSGAKFPCRFVGWARMGVRLKYQAFSFWGVCQT